MNSADDRIGIVLLLLGRQPFVVGKDDLALLQCGCIRPAATLFRFWDGCHERRNTTRFPNLLRWLTRLVEFPVPAGVPVRRVQNRLIEEIRHPCLHCITTCPKGPNSLPNEPWGHNQRCQTYPSATKWHQKDMVCLELRSNSDELITYRKFDFPHSCQWYQRNGSSQPMRSREWSAELQSRRSLSG